MLNRDKKHDFNPSGIIRRLTAAKVERGKAKAFAKEFTNGMNLSYSKEYIDYKFNQLKSDVEVSITRIRSEILKIMIFVLSLQSIYLSVLALMNA